MQIASIPKNEHERLKSLNHYEILDTAPEEDFDQLTQLASSICATPIALVSLVDVNRQWFKSNYGTELRETPRELAFCAHAIHYDDVFEVADIQADTRFLSNPINKVLPEIAYYAGAPLRTPDGFKVGTLCVLDYKPAQLNSQQKYQLTILAQQVVAQMELRKQIRIKERHFSRLQALNNSIEGRNAELDAFASRAAHDMNGPIRQISQLARFCLEDLRAGDSQEVQKNCEEMIKRCEILRVLIRDIFELTRASTHAGVLEVVNFDKLRLQTLSNVELLRQENPVELIFDIRVTREFQSNPVRLQQVLFNLVSNAIKYAKSEGSNPWVKVVIFDEQDHLTMEVRDNGLGIPEGMQAEVFKAFRRLHPEKSDGTGLGLSIIQKHVEALEGVITCNSDESGTAFVVKLPIADQQP